MFSYQDERITRRRSYIVHYINFIPPENDFSGGSYILSIKENGQLFPSTVPVFIHGDNIELSTHLLDELHIKYEKTFIHEGRVNLEQIKSIKAVLNRKELILEITVPDNWLPLQHPVIDDRWTNKFHSTNVTPGVVLDYSIYGEQPGKGTLLSSWFNTRYYNHFSYMDTSWQYARKIGVSHGGSLFRRLNSSWVFNDRKDADKLILGDIQTSSANEFTGVNMGGIQIRRDFSLRPDIVTYPTISLNGTAATPSTLDFFVNGYRKTQKEVGAGPYVINNIPFINGDGTMTVVTTDATGQRVQTRIPFNIQSNMLRPGLNDFNFALGSLRYNYGMSDDQYRYLAFSGTWRHGLTDNLTTVYHIEQVNNLAGLGLGSQYNMNQAGRIDITVAGSKCKNQKGLREYINYSKSFAKGSLNFSHVHTGSTYNEMANYGYQYNHSVTSEQVFYSQSLPGNGSLGSGIVYQKTGNSEKQIIANLSYSTTLLDFLSLSLSYSNEITTSHNNSFVIAVSLPMGSKTTYGQQIEFSHGSTTYLSSLAHNSQQPLGVDWSMSSGANNRFMSREGYKNLSAEWKTNHAFLSGGAYGYDTLSPWENIQGSVVLMDNSLFLSRQLGSSFAKVDTDGVSNVPYYLNGASQGYTDSRGVGFISDITPYQKNEIKISPNNLPENRMPTETLKTLFLPENSGYSIKFPMKSTDDTMLIRIRSQKHDIPSVGTVIKDNENNVITWVGYSGVAELPQQNGCGQHTYHINLDNGHNCRFNVRNIKGRGIHAVQCVIVD